jgi:hypothetical protein
MCFEEVDGEPVWFELDKAVHAHALEHLDLRAPYVRIADLPHNRFEVLTIHASRILIMSDAHTLPPSKIIDIKFGKDVEPLMHRLFNTENVKCLRSLTLSPFFYDQRFPHWSAMGALRTLHLRADPETVPIEAILAQLPCIHTCFVTRQSQLKNYGL